ncbi:hypothetical protein [Parvularcula maris]|uniref:Uncharacterized protein n=1 Tax=Parvularcula maris TaxID=2965077 RepID=A0A9X2RJJ9_9PROT|nr:hypothetical protein [Parvularcula maris]MCQ8185926.1 hypothetical protein [Parvularcula maris]
MVWIGRIVAALAILVALPFHAIAPAVKLIGPFNANLYEMLVGADPLVTSFVDAGWLPSMLLLVSTLALIGALIGVLRGERFAAGLIVVAAVFDALGLYFSATMGYVGLVFSIGQIVMLGLAMVVLWLLVRGVTSED